jgi:NhaA family Na+:H+ antiporter
MLIGGFLWVCVLKSGVHATLAGVVLAFTIPLRASDEHGHSSLWHLEHSLHPWVAFAILPLFAFANAGVSFAGMSRQSLLQPLPLGIAVGLFLGKQIGVVGFSWVAIKLRLARLPTGVRWREFYGMAVLCGIGFTMSLFIASLALEGGGEMLITNARLGVLLGSLFSAVSGYFFLRRSLKAGVLNR